MCCKSTNRKGVQILLFVADKCRVDPMRAASKVNILLRKRGSFIFV